jgi:hypothetical protein
MKKAKEILSQTAIQCPKCNGWGLAWVDSTGVGMFSCNKCPKGQSKEKPNPLTSKELEAVSSPEFAKQMEAGRKYNAILAWLDEYHMAFKDAKRWRVEFEKFLKKIL